eukprot:9559458-Ditylum_brightwellii.AAC.1
MHQWRHCVVFNPSSPLTWKRASPPHSLLFSPFLSNQTVTMTNTCRLYHVQAKSKKYIKKMQRCLHMQVQAKFNLCITKIISAVILSTKKAAKHLSSSSIS